MNVRSVVIDNPKLKKLLERKNEAILYGREKSQDIEDLEKEMQNIDNKIKEIEKTVDLSDIDAEAQVITDKMNAVMTEMKAVEQKIYDRCRAVVPPELGVKYQEKKDLKEKLENERNKFALKAQKIKDLIIPLTQKTAKPLLQDEFEDFSEVRLENNEIKLDFFSHLEEWKDNHRKKLVK